MNFLHIYYVTEIARYGSINKAASHLFVSQSALSRAVKDLENNLGFELFTRTPAGVIPTQQGQEFLQQAKRLNEQYAALQEQYSSKKRLPVVQLSFAAIRCVIVEMALVKFYRRYQNREYLNLCVCEERVGKIIDYVYDGLYSVGLVLAEKANRNLFFEKCRRNSITWIPISQHTPYLQIGQNHPLANRQAVTLADLSPYPRATMVQDEMETALYSSHVKGYDPQRLGKRIVINDKSTMYALLSNTDAYYIGLNLSNVRGNNHDVCYLPILDLESPFELAFIHLQSHALTPTEKELLEDIRSLVSASR